MKIIHFGAFLLAGVVLASCAAENATRPIILQPLPKAMAFTITDITCDAAPGLSMTPGDIQRNTALIREGLADVMAHASAAARSTDRPLSLKIRFTSFDRGSDRLRTLFPVMGQIKITSEVSFVDQGGSMIGRYRTFNAIGGPGGGLTSLADVEMGFQQSVLGLVKNARDEARALPMTGSLGQTIPATGLQ